jgi:hypothetical protein
MRSARLSLVLPLLLSILAVGCSGGPKLVPVTGKVTMNGKAIKNVKVAFHPDPDKGNTGPGSAGTTDDDGNFTLKCTQGDKPGAISGHHRVILTDLDTFGNVFVGRGNYRSEDGKGGTKEVPTKPRFPAVYADLAQTPLKQEVKDAMGPVTIDIKR